MSAVRAQAYSEASRRMGTYSTVGLLCFNTMLFAANVASDSLLVSHPPCLCWLALHGYCRFDLMACVVALAPGSGDQTRL